MLGHELVSAYQSAFHEVVGAAHADLDITNTEAVQDHLKKVRPDWVVLAAAYTRVDDCETRRDKAFAVNAEGAGNVAAACRDVGAKLCYISTDYVFNGGKASPYTETDDPDPVSVYGASKLAGERLVLEKTQDRLIIRTSWLYGSNGTNFIESILNKARSVPQLRVVNNQVGAPTYARDLAAAIVTLTDKNIFGILNVTNAGCCSWFDFAKKILELSGIGGVTVVPVSSMEYNAPARRPANSCLSSDRLKEVAGFTLRPWEEALVEYLRDRRL